MAAVSEDRPSGSSERCTSPSPGQLQENAEIHALCTPTDSTHGKCDGCKKEDCGV